MSKIIWSRALIPDETATPKDFTAPEYGQALVAKNTLAIETPTNDIKIPDPRAIRSMSRAAALLSSACVSAKEALEPFLKNDPYSVGVYCAVENGPVDYPTTRQLLGVSEQDFAEKYKKLRNPKMYLKQLPNLAAAQMGIFMNLMGPMNVYSHSTEASTQALDQAEFDLEHGLVKAALVCGAFSFEDPLLVMRQRMNVPVSKILAEGAGALVMINGGDRQKWEGADFSDPRFFYGVSHQIIKLAKGRN